MKAIVCEGTQREIGRAQGAGAAAQISDCDRILGELEAFRLLAPRFVPHALFVRLAERKASKAWSQEIAATSPEMAERLKGIAEGSATRESRLHLLNLLEPMMSDVRGMTVVPPLGGCSAMAVGSARARAAEPMLAHNFDYLPLVQPLYTMREVRPNDGFAALEFTCAPMAGAIDGLNEAGLCIVYDYAYVTDGDRAAAPLSMLISECLRTCERIDQAADFITSRARWGGGLLMLADASGQVASLEVSNERSALRLGEDVLHHSNRFSMPAMRGVEVPIGARFDARAPLALRGAVVHDSALVRDARFAELVDTIEAFDIDDLARVMSDHGPSGEASNSTICMHSDYWSTTASLQFFPRSRRIRVAFDSACRARYRDFVLGAHASACSA